MTGSDWKIEIHDAFDFERFLDTLAPDQEATVLLFLGKVALLPSLLDAPRSWVRPLGRGLFEFRISGLNTLVRVFFTYKKGKLILLLGGYNKGADSSAARQHKEISLARKRLGNA